MVSVYDIKKVNYDKKMNLFAWMKSTRSIAVVLFVLGVHAGLFMGLISSEIYSQGFMLVLGAYFAKRDEK